MLIGYCRTAPYDPPAALEAQRRALVAAGASKVYSEAVTDRASRAQLAAAISMCREGDTLVIIRAEAVANTPGQLLRLLDQLRGRQAGLQVLSFGLDASAASMKIIMAVLSGLAGLHKAAIKEAALPGIAAAKRRGGIYRGAPPRINRALLADLAAADVPADRAAEILGCTTSGVYWAGYTAMRPAKEPKRHKIDGRSLRTKYPLRDARGWYLPDTMPVARYE